MIESTLDNETGVVSQEETPASLAVRIHGLLRAPGVYPELRQRAWERGQTFHWSRILPGACDWLEEMAARSLLEGVAMDTGKKL